MRRSALRALRRPPATGGRQTPRGRADRERMTPSIWGRGPSSIAAIGNAAMSRARMTPSVVRGGRRFESVRGLQLSPCLVIAFVFSADGGWLFRRPPSVHQRPRVGLGCIERIEELDRVLASVAGEVAVVAVDHGQAGAHLAREVEG